MSELKDKIHVLKQALHQDRHNLFIYSEHAREALELLEKAQRKISELEDS